MTGGTRPVTSSLDSELDAVVAYHSRFIVVDQREMASGGAAFDNRVHYFRKLIRG